jgi:hypothetical protein
MKRDDRVRHIEDLMSTFSWDKCALRNCVDVWDLSEAYVQELAREAGRRISSKINEPDYVSAIVAQSLSRVLDRAEEEGDHKSVVAAAMAWHKIATLGSVKDAGLMPSDVADDDPELSRG